jgi:hypothetical protein
VAGKPEVPARRTANSATYDMGGGTFALVQDARPMNYLDDGGQWQPIDPTFMPADEGWANQANALRTSLSSRSSTARLSLSRVGVGWEPRDLVAVDLAGQPFVLATVQAAEHAAEHAAQRPVTGTLSADRRSVRYKGGWSDAALQDQWRSGFGSAEYSLRLPSLPQLPPQTAADSLDVRVNLHLAPGTQVEVDGRVIGTADLPLDAHGALAFTNGDGERLWLQPPRAYEADNPSANVEGNYTVMATADPSMLELRVRLPWRWLAAPERSFPVVIDPLFQVTSPTSYREVKYDNNSRAFLGYYTPNPLELGQYQDAVARAIIKFALPSLPPNATINQARLYAAPTGINYATRSFLATNVEAYALANDNWVSGSAEPVLSGTLGVQPMSYSAGANAATAVWDVTNLVRSWVPVMGQPNQNHGILFKVTNEWCFYDSHGHRKYPDDCGGFYFNDPSTFSEDDKQYTEGNPLQVNPSPDGGLRLAVIYSGPPLSEGQTINILGSAYGVSNPNGNAPYYHADHEYRLTALPSHWQAVVVRGLGSTFGTTPTIGQNLRGVVMTELRDGNDQVLDTGSPQYGNGNMGIILLDGRSVPGYPQNRLRVKPVPGDNQPYGYDVRLVPEKEDISVALNSTVVRSYPWPENPNSPGGFDTADPLALFNIGLPAGSNSRVDVTIDGDNEYINTGLYDYARDFGAQLFEPGTSAYRWYQGATRRYREVARIALSSGSLTPGSMRLSSGIFTPAEDRYALTLAYNGPRMGTLVQIKRGEFWESTVGPLKFGYTVRITACGYGMFPTKNGACQQIKCPSLSFPAANRRDNVGGLQLWSEEGWSSGSAPATSTAVQIAPLIGPTGSSAPRVAVVGGQISYDGAGNVGVDEDSNVLLVNCGTLSNPNNPLGPSSYFQVYEGAMAGHTTLAPSGNGTQHFDPWPGADRGAGDVTGETFIVAPVGGTASGAATLWRRTGTDLTFSTSYTVTVDGWPSLASSVAENGTADPPPIASLIVDLGGVFSLDTQTPTDKFGTRTFEAVRAHASEATVTQPAELGGASKPIQVVILQVGMVVPSDPAQSCSGSCVDLRALEDAANLKSPRRVFQMPDVHTNIHAGSVVMSGKGTLQVYSVDHPSAADSPSAGSQDYSFDAFGSSVSVQQEPCDAGGPVVTVVRGETRMTMPNLGNGSDPNMVVAAKFKLCSTSLRGVSFQFSSPVGIPIGASGLFATGLRGSVDIYPAYTTIKFGLDFQATPAGDGGIFKGSGNVTIDTRGLFAFEGAGRLLGTLDASGSLWVAWNPLDTGFNMNVSYHDWLTGFARAHMWEGQGWQHRYNWLPDNGEKHVAAQIGATITIEKGAAFSWWFIDIPPFDMDFGIEVSFGQFCINSSCSTYEWGVKGAFSVAGYDVGLYYGFSHGFDFILGNDDHVLIDQYGGMNTAAQTSLGNASDAVARSPIQAASPAVSGVATETFAVSANAETVLVGLGWQAGAPQLKLLDPAGALIISTTAHPVFISTTANSMLVGVRLNSPLAGNWKAVVSNLTGQERYKLVYLSNKGAPGTPSDRGHFLTPGIHAVDGTNAYTLTWQVPAGASVSTTVGLYYTHMVWNFISLSWKPDNQATDVPIVKNLPFVQGTYRWDTSWLPSGRYQVRAIVDDGINDFPAVADNPDDTCQPRSALPSARAFDHNRFPGISTFSAVGAITISDTVAPPAPTGLTLKGVDSAILARWDPTPGKDIAGYVVHWGHVSFYYPGPWHWTDAGQDERVPATLSPTLRIVGLQNISGPSYGYGVAVRAIDVSGNIGPTSTIQTASPVADPSSQVPLAPLTPTLVTTGSNSVRLAWQPNPSGVAPARYRVVYRELVTFSTVLYTDTTGTAVTLRGLRTGATYEAAVSAANAEGWHSASSPSLRFIVTNGIDANHDGLPDDWEHAYGIIVGPFTLIDPDGDGLSNVLEYALGTNPQAQDTDGDGFTDLEEYQAHTDPLDATSYPAQHSVPRLSLSPDSVTFRTKKGALELSTQFVDLYNQGGGTMKLGASSSARWVTPTVMGMAAPLSADSLSAAAQPQAGSVVQIDVDTRSLKPGYYTGTVRLYRGPSGDPLTVTGSGYCVRVAAWVSPPDSFRIYVPAVRR